MLGIAAGLLVSAGVSRLLRSFLFGISTIDPATFGGVIAVMIGVAMLAAFLPARRAAKLDPMVVLRQE
jgi:ABC-type antimicrobial peptide transport system permease subunit